MYISNQSFLVLGVSKSGYAVAERILQSGGKCFLYEQLKSEKIEQSIATLSKMGGVLVNDSQIDELFEKIDALVISPGVPINHEVAVKAKRKGVRILGELEFGWASLRPIVVAVTGTNGKTTTCTMIDQILKEASRKNLLVGNIGEPLTGKIDEIDYNTVCVTEVSSFQLESVYSFCPHISCVLNIAPDHLERHYSMENYLFLKKRIFKNQRESEYCVLNADDKTVKEFGNETRAKIIWVSVQDKVKGAYLESGSLCYDGEEIIKQKDLAMGGIHNVYNALFAICVAKLLGVKNQVISHALQNMKGVKHRIELIEKIDGVEYYNDSKATNVSATLSALDCMTKPTILILGGSEKGETYEAIFEKVKQRPIKHVVLTGASKYAMLDCAGRCGYTDVTVTPDFEFAVKISNILAEDGDCVLLSPACASYDFFKSFEERGEKFSQIVRSFY